jgi:hypothetical protein
MVAKSMAAATSNKEKKRHFHATALVVGLALAVEVAVLQHLPCSRAVVLVSTPLFWR